MELLVKKRSPVRANFTKTYNALLDILKEDESSLENIEYHLTKLERIYLNLSELDSEICEDLLKNPDTQKYEIEYDAIEEYNDKMDMAKVSVKTHFNKIQGDQKANSIYSSPIIKEKKLKLPKIELMKFKGEVKDWLAFWSQFKRIHEDGNMEKEDKFQYLIQSMSEGTRAREIIDSYPPTSDNYDKAIDSLKSRFGRDELLIEFYVRELLKLVVKNATEVKRRLNTSQLYDKLESYLRALESIGLTSDKYSAMLFPLVESCIPEELFRVWLRNPVIITNSDLSNNAYSEKLKNLLLFLKTEVEGEERILLAKSGFTNRDFNEQKEKAPHSKQPTATDLFSGAVEKRRQFNNCVFCDKSHESKECFQAQKLNLEQKQEILRKKKCCFICLKIGHRSNICKTNVMCVICTKKHCVLMCPDLAVNKMQHVKLETEQLKPQNHSLYSHCTSEEVILQTLQVKIKSEGKERLVRALIDSGSQRSYVLEKTVKKLDIKPIETKSLIHSLFGGSTTHKQDHQLYKLNIESLCSGFSCEIQVLDQQVICGKIPRLRRGSWEEELREKKIWLTDYGQGCPDIELLLGADVCGQLMTGNIQKLQCGLVAWETRFGWLIMGKVPGEMYDTAANVVTSLLIKNNSVADLWKMDVLGIRDPLETKSREEKEHFAIEHFQKTVNRDTNGRYVVKLPWLEDRETLPTNKILAEQRCVRTTQKLQSDGRFADYDAVFGEWLEEGIIEEVPENQLENAGYYLPHRGVFKKSSTTTVRPVFDASCRTKNLPSLNECLEKGPNLIEEIPPILMRFRSNAIGVVSDIKKAFLQISIAKEDQDFLRFLWWEDFEKQKLKVYRHRRVVFGLTCSPFLLAAVLSYHLEENKGYFPETANKLKNSFYVDNCVTSVSSEKELTQFIQEAKQILATACFDLRGWEHTTVQRIDESKEPIPILGILWDKNKDVLYCDVDKTKSDPEPITKRGMLSTVQRIFDPLGVLCPVTICLKCLIQESWNLKIGWDEILPEEIQQKFKLLTTDLTLLSEVRIPRFVNINGSTEGLSLHTFCDASKSAYSTIVFLRTTHGDEVLVFLIQAKSRVAPLQKVTIPRLELLACNIGARLTSTIRKEMDLGDIPSIFWTDSSTALYWIQNEENWGTFVNNRVKEIRKLSAKEDWRHIPGNYNPADLPSRGCSVKAFLRSGWWEGPLWLKQEEENWPVSKIQTDQEEVSKERKKGVMSLVNTTELKNSWYLHRFSKYSQILRLIAWILRFIRNSQKLFDKAKGELTVSEIETAEKSLVKIIQQEIFTSEYRKSKFKTFCIFHDSNGLMRLKTKILRREDEENFKSPLILPSDHPIVEKLIFERHLFLSHGGVQMVLADVRQHFWIIKGRKTVQRVISKCLRCKRYSAKKIESLPTPLPEDRVRDALIFEVTGVDLAGPLHLKDGKKAWILLFTCAVYRAIHLELIQSLSTKGFLLGLRRFIARRGRPKKIYSDNGTNFVGTENLMSSLDWNQIVRESSISRIQWKFNPPTAAWWGGWWERIVQMIKKLLRRVLGKASLHYEEMLTVLCDTEAVINARPLTYLSEDPKDLTPLTPAMFLQDNQTVGVPDLDQLDLVNISKRYKYLQRLREGLRKRFRDEYLSLLVQQPQRKNNIRDVKLGDVVLVECDHKKRLDWPMGRIVASFPGKDNCTRVVKVKTVFGEFIRPVQRLYPLEINEDDVLVRRFDPVTSSITPDGSNKESSSEITELIVPDGSNKESSSARTELIIPDKKQNCDSKDINCAFKTRCGRKVVKPFRYK